MQPPSGQELVNPTMSRRNIMGSTKHPVERHRIKVTISWCLSFTLSFPFISSLLIIVIPPKGKVVRGLQSNKPNYLFGNPACFTLQKHGSSLLLLRALSPCFCIANQSSGRLLWSKSFGQLLSSSQLRIQSYSWLGLQAKTLLAWFLDAWLALKAVEH